MSTPRFNYTQNAWEGEKYDRNLDITDIAKNIRKDLKVRFPKCKFSITIQRYSGGQSMSISLLEGPFKAILSERTREWENGEEVWKDRAPSSYTDFNHYYPESYKEDSRTTRMTLHDECIEAMKFAAGLAQGFNFDDSDPMTDYFHTNFYLHMHVGRWDKPFRNNS
jgi:hypothetical protein